MNASLNHAARTASMGIVGLILLCGGVGVWSTWQLSGALSAQRDAAALLRNHMTADMMHDAVRSDVLAILQSRNPASGISVQEATSELAEHVQTLEKRVTDDADYKGSAEVAAATGKLAAPMKAYTAEAGAIAAGAARGNDVDMTEFLKRFHDLEESMAGATDVIENHSETAAENASRLGHFAIGLVLLALLASIAAALIASRAVRSYLVNPLLNLTEAMRGLARGERDTVIPSLQRKDELGALAIAMAEFSSQLKAADSAKNAQAQLIVQSIGSGLGALAVGNLTTTVSADLPPPFVQLKSNFNEAVGRLRDLIGAVSDSARTIRTGSNEIAQASEDLARRTESSAASLEETAASITQMDGRLKAGALAATRTVERADRAIATVGGGRAVADDAVQAMGRVSESAEGIDSVIEGLDKIAFQTRVLAMNAAVEAGRAGEAGRGFAVVADLVSALAMRAEEEAKRARDQLTVTQTDIVTAVEAVRQVDGVLSNISDDVGQVHELLATMAVDHQAQSAAITQISAAIGTMDQATQQNAAMVEQTSAAARNLAAEVSQLADQAGLFNVGGIDTRRVGGTVKPDYINPATYTSMIDAVVS